MFIAFLNRHGRMTSVTGLPFHMLPSIIMAPIASAAHIVIKLASSSKPIVDFAIEIRPNSSKYFGNGKRSAESYRRA